MQLSFYLHDLFYEIGHSNVTLNTIEYMDDIEKSDIKFIVFTSDDKKNLFKKQIKTQIHFVPFGNLKPVLLKIIWFQIYTLFYALIVDRRRTKVSLGVASLWCDITILHFIHHQWHDKYFELLEPSRLKGIYKKIQFSYLDLCEHWMFKILKPKIITVSKYMKDYIVKKFDFNDDNIKAIHSGFDLSRFSNSELEENDIKSKLATENPQSLKIDTTKPVFLFVGAFERKGLPIVLKKWKEDPRNSQLVIIGQAEGQSNLDLQHEGIIYIPFTKNINLYYEISDYLLFPTHYEPFGMVLIEAAIKGLNIITTKENVGASEILNNIDGITLVRNSHEFEMPKNYLKINKLNRKENINNRLDKLKNYNWKKCSSEYSKILRKWSFK